MSVFRVFFFGFYFMLYFSCRVWRPLDICMDKCSCSLGVKLHKILKAFKCRKRIPNGAPLPSQLVNGFIFELSMRR